MGRALVISDTHGQRKRVKQVVAQRSFDYMFHCGDFCVDEHESPFSEMVVVKGNNDTKSNVPLRNVVEWEGIRFFITHGHLYEVNQTLLRLGYAAQEVQADVVLFGHTHYPLCVQEDGLIYINPGSFKRPRGFRVPTYAVLSVTKKKETTRLRVTYYDSTYRHVKSLGKRFTIDTNGK